MPADLLRSFAQELSLSLDEKQLAQLTCYAQCVWEKKDFLNLTSVENLDEIFTRHLADGLVAAAKIAKFLAKKPITAFTLADVGSGAGYIGFTLAVALPQAKVTCIESLEKRCSFMNWAALKASLPNLRVQKARLGQEVHAQFDVVTERAMGQLPDILPICMQVVKPGGIFLAYQGQYPQTQNVSLPKETVLLGVERYTLPYLDNKQRHIVLFSKEPKND